MMCPHCNLENSCRPLVCERGCGNALGCLRPPDGGDWTEDEWGSRLAGYACSDCPAPVPTLEEQLDAQGTNLHEASLLLVQVQGDAAPQWARDYVADYISRMEGLPL